MFSSIFSSLGGALGQFLGGGMFSSIGRYLGSWIGEAMDDDNEISFYSIGKTTDSLFPVSDAAGKPIALVFGKARVNGELIWTSPIKEVPIDSCSVKYFKNYSAKYFNTEFSYYCDFAIAICEGKIDGLERVWAGGEILDLSAYEYELYLGNNDQMPSFTIASSLDSPQMCPAFRGLAYIVLKNFPLLDYGNKLPYFSFEVRRKVVDEEYSVKNKIRAINIIPGSGEYVYDTYVQKQFITLPGGNREEAFLNMNNSEKKADALFALNYISDLCPNINWISLVVCWFGDDLNIGKCSIFPAVEFGNSSTSYTDEWQVAGFTRATAREISKDEFNSPNYGGTVTDASLVRLLDEMRSRGYKIMLYPMIFMDIPGKPWRGHLTGEASEVNNFFNKIDGYNNFIIHYARLTKFKVDAFIIGSELKAITQIIDGKVFPAVAELCALAEKVKEIMGESTLISYAADWSEYHHCGDGWYHLDDLWASSAIDFVGIDNYMPLTMAEDYIPSYGEIISGFNSGEGFDYYLNQGERKKLLAPYAWKNVKWWWENIHINPNGQRTSWRPKMKKIWFTEYGFPSIDKATNQPNVFYDPKCLDGGAPRFSNSQTDFAIQKRAIKAFIEFWSKEEYIENMFLWCVDLRPYPAWPHTRKWKDYGLWEKGHWINGKFNNSSLAVVLIEIATRSGIDKRKIFCNFSEEEVYDFAITKKSSIIDFIYLLQNIYKFDIRCKIGGGLEFVKVSTQLPTKVDCSDLIPDKNNYFESIFEEAAFALSRSNIVIRYKNLEQEYENVVSVGYAENNQSNSNLYINLPFCMTGQDGDQISRLLQANKNAQREYMSMRLPYEYIYLEVGGLLALLNDYCRTELRVLSIKIESYLIHIYAEKVQREYLQILPNVSHPIQNIQDIESIEQIIMPAYFNYEEDVRYLYFINYASNAKSLRISRDGDYYNKVGDIKGGSCKMKILGMNISSFASVYYIDEESYIDVKCELGEIDISTADLFSCKSLFYIDQENIIYVGVIMSLGYNCFRLSNIIFKDSKTLERILVGSELMYIGNIYSLQVNDAANYTNFIYQKGNGSEANVIY